VVKIENKPNFNKIYALYVKSEKVSKKNTMPRDEQQ
tara:strand:+ start:173 stop:280 length:108 start_codon:yes stop_codon:yes gene_type:complete